MHGLLQGVYQWAAVTEASLGPSTSGYGVSSSLGNVDRRPSPIETHAMITNGTKLWREKSMVTDQSHMAPPATGVTDLTKATPDMEIPFTKPCMHSKHQRDSFTQCN